MIERPVEILLVEDDFELAQMIEQHLVISMGSNVTHVTSAAEALREELTTRHDLIMSSLSLPDGEGLSFIKELRRENKCPVVVMGENPTVEEAIQAVRAGVREFLIKPFDFAFMSEVVQQLAEHRLKQLHQRKRIKRLRKIASGIIRERKDLHRRMDLICRDFVHAYRRLAQKVSETGLLPHHQDE